MFIDRKCDKWQKIASMLMRNVKN